MAYDPLCTVDLVKSYLNITASTDDARIDMLIGGVSELIGRWCNRENLGASITYTENYRFPKNPKFDGVFGPSITLRKYPVTTLTSVMTAGQSVPIITDPTQPVNSGCWIDDDERTLVFIGFPSPYGFALAGRLPIIQVTYTAGYNGLSAVPQGLAYVAAQAVAEAYKSPDWIAKQSVSLGGQQTMSVNQRVKGLSPAIVAMLNPYKDRLPLLGTGA